MDQPPRLSESNYPVGPQPARIVAAETPGLSGLLTLAVGVVAVAGLYLGRGVLIPFTLAVLLSFVLAPLANLLRRLHLGRVPSVLIAVLMALGVMLALGGLIGSQLAALSPEVPTYAARIQGKLATLQQEVQSHADFVMRRLGQATVTKQPEPQAAPANAPGGQAPVPVVVRQPEPTPIELAEKVLSPIVDPLMTLAIVLVVTVFILLQREDLRDRMIRLFGSSDLHRTTVAMNDAARRLSRYFLTQLAVNTSFGVVTAIGLSVIGVPSPVLCGVIGLLLRFVPYIGAPLAAALPLTLAGAVESGWSMLVWTAGLYAVTELVIGQAVEPMVYGRSTGLSPVSVVVSATFWTWLWGPIGLILSTPLTLCLVVLGRHVERLEFLDVILGDRPALTPVESFYQRMLAGDPNEAREQAEALLRDMTLSSYYDEVALKGLQLAANDAARGVLTELQRERIRRASKILIEDLDDYDDDEPASRQEQDNEAATPSRHEQNLPRHPALGPMPPDALAPGWREGVPVLCIAGRGPLDEIAVAMLGQVLQKNGIGTRVLPHEAVSRANIAHLDVQDVRMVCLCYLELSGAPSHLRYLLRRLRQRLPDARLLVGLWPTDQAILTDDRLRAAVGADIYTSSLRETLEACLDAAPSEAEPVAA
jgi:predicted PurR-regulated permease PerM